MQLKAICWVNQNEAIKNKEKDAVKVCEGGMIAALDNTSLKDVCENICQILLLKLLWPSAGECKHYFWKFLPLQLFLLDINSFIIYYV